MFKQKPFPFSFIILGILVILHSLGSYLSWYWLYPWFDIVVHIFCGMWIALVILWLASCFDQLNSIKKFKTKSFLIALLSAVLIGILWEIVENLSQITFVDSNSYNLNTASDLLSDTVGGLLAYLYFVKRKPSKHKTFDVLHPFYNKTGLTNK